MLQSSDSVLKQQFKHSNKFVKMKACLVLFAIVCAVFVTNSMAVPVLDAFEVEGDIVPVEVDPPQEGAVAVHVPSRQKRATCDLLSYLGVNNSACAAHCILLGRKGGYCNNKAVCVCRD